MASPAGHRAPPSLRSRLLQSPVARHPANAPSSQGSSRARCACLAVARARRHRGQAPRPQTPAGPVLARCASSARPLEPNAKVTDHSTARAKSKSPLVCDQKPPAFAATPSLRSGAGGSAGGAPAVPGCGQKCFAGKRTTLPLARKHSQRRQKHRGGSGLAATRGGKRCRPLCGLHCCSRLRLASVLPDTTERALDMEVRQEGLPGSFMPEGAATAGLCPLRISGSCRQPKH